MIFKDISKKHSGKTYREFAIENIENYLDYPICKVNGTITDLNETIKPNDTVEYLHKESRWGSRAYNSALNKIFLKAFYRLFPSKKAYLNHYLGSGMYVTFDNQRSLTLKEIKDVETEMRKVVDEDILIEEKTVSIDRAKEIFSEYNRDILDLLETIDMDSIQMSVMGSYLDLSYEVTGPSTGYIRDFELRSYYPGLLLISPNRENSYNIKNYRESPKLAKTYQNSTERYKSLDLFTVASINKKVEDNKGGEIIGICEAIFSEDIVNAARTIAADKDYRIVLISGPSSSGKTTFTYRLNILLKSMGINPIVIGMDDYFKDREDTPVLENGELDFESPQAILLDEFNEDLYKLLNGEPIQKRVFDFIDGVNIVLDDQVVPKDNSIIIIEGIHALNPMMSTLVPEKNKYKIYLSALTQVNFDAHNRISSSDTRFIRRAVRDYEHRGSDIERSFRLWEGVRLGEEKYIFPYQETANVVINTALPYELSILKKHIMPLLDQVGPDSFYYTWAKRIENILKFFKSIDDDSLVSSESLLMEFIGKGD